MWKNLDDLAIIPKKFTICGSNYKVNFVESSERDLNGALGDFSNLTHEIRIALEANVDDSSTMNVPEDELLKTYLHELGHCFNYYYNSENSEEFANAFANFMYEYLHTKE